jgi:hypothetical protein
MLPLLIEMEQEGLVAHDTQNRWRLTDIAERRFGGALRGLARLTAERTEEERAA